MGSTAAQKATSRVNYAVKTGKLERPDTCELCGQTPGPATKQPKEIWWKRRNVTFNRIIAHHWRGYEGDAALDVWWICSSCNAKIIGKRYHAGNISKDEAREIVKHNLINLPDGSRISTK